MKGKRLRGYPPPYRRHPDGQRNRVEKAGSEMLLAENGWLMFEVALDVPADSLMYLQTKYNMQTARKDSSLFDVLKEIRKIAAVF